MADTGLQMPALVAVCGVKMAVVRAWGRDVKGVTGAELHLTCDVQKQHVVTCVTTTELIQRNSSGCWGRGGDHGPAGGGGTECTRISTRKGLVSQSTAVLQSRVTSGK